MMDYLDAIKACDKQSNSLNCKFRVLHAITQEQDLISLNLKESVDERAIPLEVINKANGIILNISSKQGKLTPADKTYLSKTTTQLNSYLRLIGVDV